MNVFERAMWIFGYVKVQKGDGILVRPHYRKPTKKKSQYIAPEMTQEEMREFWDGALSTLGNCKTVTEPPPVEVQPAQIKMETYGDATDQ